MAINWNVCSRCGSKRLVVGSLYDTGFRPRRLKKVFSLSGMVKVDAVACLDCGKVELDVDPAKLGELAEEPEDLQK